MQHGQPYCVLEFSRSCFSVLLWQAFVFRHVFVILSCSVRYIEGTVKQLLEDKSGTVVGVEYRDKATENVQVQNSL